MKYLVLIVIMATGARGASWDDFGYLLPEVGLDTQLSTSGRSACLDSEGTLHVLLRGRDESDLHRLYLTQELAGKKWSDPQSISLTGNALRPSIAADSHSGLHVIWYDDVPVPTQVKYRYRSASGGWQMEEVLSDIAEPSLEPILCVDAQDRIHCFWVEENPLASQLMHTWKTVGGTWNSPESLPMLDTEVHEPTATPGLAGSVHVVFVGDPPGKQGLHLFHVTMDRVTGRFGVPEQLTNPANHFLIKDPFVESAPDGTLYLVWMDNRFRSASTSFDIYLRRFLPDVGWGHEKLVTYVGTTHGNPAIIGGIDNSWNLVFETFFTGNPQVAFRQITRAFGWDPNLTFLTSSLGASENPQVIGKAGGELLLLWTEADVAGVKQVHALRGVGVQADQ